MGGWTRRSRWPEMSAATQSVRPGGEPRSTEWQIPFVNRRVYGCSVVQFGAEIQLHLQQWMISLWQISTGSHYISRERARLTGKFNFRADAALKWWITDSHWRVHARTHLYTTLTLTWMFRTKAPQFTTVERSSHELVVQLSTEKLSS